MDNNKMKPIYDMLSEITAGIVDKMFTANDLNVGSYGLLIHDKRGAYGYCYVKENWKVNDMGVREIALTKSGLMQGKEGIFKTLTHELIHAVNGELEVQDCTGARHNNKFADMCDVVGLKYEKGYPKVNIHTPPQWNDVFEGIYQSLDEESRKTLDNIQALLDTDEEKKKAKDRNLKVFICPECGQKARAKGEASLLCGECSTEDSLIRMETEG